MRLSRSLLATAVCVSLFPLQGCHSVDDDRIPTFAVSINLGDAATWNTYGVAGYGMHRRFILSQGLREPSGFPYSQQSATGFGGVLLISGMDPFTTATDSPLAYDLSCPMEVKSSVRVEIESERYEAVCPVCGSRFDVAMGGGAPISGPRPPANIKSGCDAIVASLPATAAISSQINLLQWTSLKVFFI